MPLILTVLTLMGPALVPLQPVDFQLNHPFDRMDVVAERTTIRDELALGEQSAASLSKAPFSSAQGFGYHVPLAFAVRQIVPPAVHVSFGPGVDPSTSVDWKGGQPWNRVLKLAVTPAGLQSQTGHMSVRITRK